MIGMRQPLNLNRLQQYSHLCKVKVSLFSALSAVVGCLLAPSPVVGRLAVVGLGVFLLACAGSALNQYQERDIDALMQRTRNRPLPAGTILPRHALLFALSLMAPALALFLVLGTLPALFLGLFAVLWYNLLYTSLKRKTAFAIIPGALVGAIPPAIGWVMGGGGLTDPRLGALGFLFFMWQVPHFWLFLLEHGREYEQAGLPTLHTLFSLRSLSRISFHWIVALAATSLCVSLYGLTHAPVIQCALVAAAVWITWNTRGLLTWDGSGAGRLFRMVNAYMFMVALGIALDSIQLPFLAAHSVLGLF
jgi:protoheme IX farnesyltransferase